jgi:hypothetical protein
MENQGANQSLMTKEELSVLYIERIKNEFFFQELINLQCELLDPSPPNDETPALPDVALTFIKAFCSLDLRIENNFTAELNAKATPIKKFLTSLTKEDLEDSEVCSNVRDYGRAYAMILKESGLDKLTEDEAETFITNIKLPNELLKNE